MSQFLGHNYIGGQRSANGSVTLKSVDASTGEALPQDFYQATPQEVDAAAKAAGSTSAPRDMSRAALARRLSGRLCQCTNRPINSSRKPLVIGTCRCSSRWCSALREV